MAAERRGFLHSRTGLRRTHSIDQSAVADRSACAPKAADHVAQ
jgi:hypothetical protein